MPDDPTVDRIDHVALTVPDRDEAAAWYEDVLGLEPLERFDEWPKGGGPLVVSSDDGHTMLALFEGQRDEPELRHLAFHADGAAFLAFVDQLAARDDVAVAGREDVVDHDLAWSVYFEDPYGHDFEIATYDYEYVADRR